MELERSCPDLAAVLAVADVDSWNIEIYFLQLSRMGMIVRPTSATVATPNTAVADSLCLGNCPWFDCRSGCVESVERFRKAVYYAPTARASKGLSTVKLAKVKGFSDQSQS